MDKILFFTVIILSLFGLLMIYSSSSIWADYKFNDSFHYVKYQGVFFIIGLSQVSVNVGSALSTNLSDG